MGKILDGKSLANLRAQKLKKEIEILKQDGIKPLFCVINIGDDPASKVYVKTKKRRAQEMGIEQKIYQLPSTESEESVLNLIDELNQDRSVHGIMVQMPTPEQIDVNHLLERIDPEKDVDGLTPTNIGHLWQSDHFVEPATAIGIMKLLEHYKINVAGKNVAIIGRSNIVGKPLAALMLEKDASVSVLHSKTKSLSTYTRMADIIIVAAGQANLLTSEMVEKGAVVIDVGINRVEGHLVGDVDFKQVLSKASWITPVPGGVGPLTVELLMEQVVKLTRRAHGIK
ncbi:tetrahydrofolate dehydrogenase/cyclohydrolase catalytic domain-containing protein [Lactobacillus intestinalis]|uniref:tetrahydrofolate dehydrogenase/cyclohydrolase catalytic domain-containing protein n=1 Tax=Lactobacillus intestinalis TaxID=151781 RepID=UPI00260C155C|nr:tetrahydrofolate dehydrogenase/cyclohydrolase catalytic domain-containing protein [Lactobacillus intestinalis]